MSRQSLFRIVLAATVMLPVSLALAWDAQVTGSGPGRGVARAVTTMVNGDVIAGGSLDENPDGARFAVVRLNGQTGAERWRTVLPGSGLSPTLESEGVTAVAVDHAGDVLAVGRLIPNPFDSPTLTVAKLAGDTGAVQWRYDLLRAEPQGIVIDDANDAYVAATSRTPAPTFTVMKLLGATGGVDWTFQQAGFAADVAMLPDQDLVVAGAFSADSFLTAGVPRITPIPPIGAVLRLDRATGLPLWTNTGGPLPEHVVTTAGDVFVATKAGFGPITTGMTFGLSGATGAILWTREFDSFASVDAIVPTAAGDVAILGIDVAPGTTYGQGATNLHALVLAQADGATLSEHVVPPRDDGILCDPCYSDAVVTAILADPSGDVSIVGSFRFFELVATRLGAPDLHEVWRRDGGSASAVPGLFMPEAAVRGMAGALVVAGARRPSFDQIDAFTVSTLDGNSGAVHACGDGTIDPGEACDDGNRLGGDCCSADCTASEPDGTACVDGSVCTLGDHCVGGLCYGGSRLPCEPCGQCDAAAGCYIGPSGPCGRSTITDGATLEIARTPRGHDRFTWSLRSGPATTKQALGNPLDATAYAVCGSLPDGRVVLRAVAPAGSCGRRHCWRSTRGGFEYANASAPDGLTHLSLRSGAGGQTRFNASGARDRLLVPSLPVEAQLRIELRRVDDSGMCWSSTLPTVSRNSTRRFRAKGN